MVGSEKGRLSRSCRHVGAFALRHDASDGGDRHTGSWLGKRLGRMESDRWQLQVRHRAQLRRSRRRQQRPVRRRHRHRLLRALIAGIGLPGRIRLSDRDNPGSGEHCSR